MLDMARSIPRPKSPARSRGPHSPSRGNGNVNYHAHPPQQPDSSPSHGMAPSQRDTPPRKAANEGSFSPSRRPETMARKETSPIAAYLRPPSAQSNLSNQTGNQPSSPYRYYPSSNGLTPPRPSGRTSAGSPHKADYLEPPKVSRRGAASLSNRDDGDQPAAIAARNSNARSSPASVTTVKAGEMSMDAQSSNSQPRSQLQQGVFRQSQRPSKEDKSNLPPPVQEVTVSNDEDDDGLYDPRALSKPNQTNIFISPHYVPHMSPHKVNMSSSTGETPSSRTTSTFSGLPVSPDSKLEIGNTSAIQKQYSYDVEESCMITDRLGNGGEGQLPDDYSASMPSKETADTNRKIMVMRPYRSSPGDHSITSPTSFASGRKHMIDDDDDDSINRKGATADTRDSLYGSDMEYSSKTSSWSSQAHRNEREVTLSRARALLQANQDNLDSPQVQLAGKPPFLHSPDRVKQQLFQNKGGGDDKDESLGQDLEDGLAPLGSSDSPSESSPQKRSFGFHRKMLTDQPETHLREIYDEASRCMKNHHYAEAIECFQAILQCHRQKHGPYHQDVASALHNCGLAHLRANNNHEAVKCFEEAVRIRKGVLGKEHPHVAASLVKCGITFLLLHRYEEALWSFREALSVRKHALGNLHPSTARIYNNIGCVHVEFNELREARRAFEAALDIQRNALCNDPESGPVRFGAATTLCNLGYLYRYRGMHEKAALVLKEASDVSMVFRVYCYCCCFGWSIKYDLLFSLTIYLFFLDFFQIQEAILGQTHPTVLSTLDSLAEALVNSGQSLHALRTHETILERIRSMEQPGSPRLIKAEAVLQYKMSKACKQLNDKESQIRHLQQALQATRSQEVQTDAAQIQAAALEKKILQDLRDVRESMEASQLKWV